MSAEVGRSVGRHEVGSALPLHALPEWDALDVPVLDAIVVFEVGGRVGRRLCSINRTASGVALVLDEFFVGSGMELFGCVPLASLIELCFHFIEEVV